MCEFTGNIMLYGAAGPWYNIEKRRKTGAGIYLFYNMTSQEGRAMIQFNHFNFNVLDLERSMKFYDDALGLKPVRERVAEDGSFRLVFLGDGRTDFRLELTWLRDRTKPYDLGECEFHLAFQTDEFDAWHEKHREMGIICFENPGMGIYFISDPDGYWVEIVPVRD